MRLGDKNVQRALNIRTFERLQAAQAAWAPLAFPSINFTNSETNVDMVGTTTQVALTTNIGILSKISSHPQSHSFAPSSYILAVPTLDRTIQSQQGNESENTQTFGNPLDENDSLSINDGNNDPIPQLYHSHVKRSNLYAHDSEVTERLLRKTLNDAKNHSSLASVPASPMLASTPDQSRSDIFVGGPRPRSVKNRREETVQDVEKAMNLPLGCSRIWRNTLNSSIGSSTSSTTKSGNFCFSLIDPLAFATNDI